MRKREWLMVLVSIVFIVVQAWLDLKLPDYMANVTTLVETADSTIREIVIQGGFMLLCAIGSALAMLLTSYFAAKIAAGYGASLRSDVFRKVMSFNKEELGRFSTASLITRSTNDVTQIMFVVVMGIQAIIKAPVIMFWAIFNIAGQLWQCSVATAGAVVIIVVIMAIAIVLALPKFRQVQRLTDNLNRITQENLTGVRVVRA